MELDTGAKVSIISLSTKNKLFPDLPLNKSSIALRTYTNEKVKVVGEIPVELAYKAYKGQTAMVTVYIVERDGPSLFGCDWLEHFRLDWKMIVMATVERNSKLEPMLQKYKSVFSKDLGTV